jgi:hypothetical protein
LDGVLYHFRDSSGYEIDDVIVLPDGRWAVIEVKLGEMFIEEAAAKLLAVTERINTRTIGAPSFSAILYAGQYAYQRKDGVFVIPLGCLGP